MGRPLRRGRLRDRAPALLPRRPPPGDRHHRWPIPRLPPPQPPRPPIHPLHDRPPHPHPPPDGPPGLPHLPPLPVRRLVRTSGLPFASPLNLLFLNWFDRTHPL